MQNEITEKLSLFPRALSIRQESFVKAIEFIKELDNLREQIPHSGFRFNMLNCNVSFFRQPDPEMTLDTFLNNYGDDAHMYLTFFVGRKDTNPFYKTADEAFEMRPIFSLVTRGLYVPGVPDEEKFIWYYAPLNAESYGLIDKSFEKVYSRKMADYPSHPVQQRNF